jgi:hypothetical protein
MGDIADYYRNQETGNDWLAERQSVRKPEKDHYHTCKDGRKIKIRDLEDSHLVNIVKLIRRKAKEGFTVSYGSVGTGQVDDMWYDELTFYGKQVRKMLKYKRYKKELKFRKLKINK